ncbi:MAG: ribonuclease HII [Methylacidiphilales bacterium]|nr:ribonuclease HII [Candidatus Methylacidiphilales bacterium]MDW8348827.1 ribonuclease HII [Verrucomicrobiae bacterium]
MDWELEPKLLQKYGWPDAAGLDEAGRGPWAGPVVAAAVLIRDRKQLREQVPLLRDSKKLSPRQRKIVADQLKTSSSLVWSVAIATAQEIDASDILKATQLAMYRALQNLEAQPGGLWIDGNPMRQFEMNAVYFKKGDDLLPSIAAASVLAKVTRDSIMEQLHERYPQYGFARHKGYGTADHAAALKKWGPCPEHRRSFTPVRSAACTES